MMPSQIHSLEVWSPDVTIIEGDNFSHLGGDIESAGDFNGDGFNDFLVSATNLLHFGDRAGSVFMFFGGKTLNLTLGINSANISIHGENDDDKAGTVATTIGDVNNDGFDDIAIGAPLNDDLGGDAGKIYIILGNTSDQFSSSASLGSSFFPIEVATFTGEGAGDEFGSSIAGVGDINNDSYDDFIVASPEYSNSKGKVYLFLGRNDWSNSIDLISSANGSFIGETDTDAFGYTLAGIGDFNKDNYPDFAIGSWYDAPDKFGVGKTYIYFGGHNNWDHDSSALSSDISFVGENQADYSDKVTELGDVNGDGYSDIAISSDGWHGFTNYGIVYLLFGGNNWVQNTSLSVANSSWIGEFDGQYVGKSISGGGDVNSDGYADLVVLTDDGIFGSASTELHLILGRTNFPTQTYINNSDYSWGIDSPIDFSRGVVKILPDINNDNIDEISVSSPDFDFFGPGDPSNANHGRMYLYYGSSNFNVNSNVVEIGQPITTSFGTDKSSSSISEIPSNTTTTPWSFSIIAILPIILILRRIYTIKVVHLNDGKLS